MEYMEVLNAFASHQRARGLSEHTIDRRRYSLRKMATFAEPVPLLAVTPELIEDWLCTFRTPETKHAYLADVRALFHWASRRGLVEKDPTDLVDPVRRPQALPRPIPDDELALAIATADDRLQLVLLLGALAGLRRAEIARLRAEDCTQRHVVVRNGKGAKDRVIPMHPFLWSTIRAYGRRHGWLFPSADGLSPVKPAVVGSWVRLHFKRLAIEQTLHATRHAFGTHLAELSNGNLLAVKELLGHSDVSTTQRYTAFDSSRLAELVEQLKAG